jgi:hypothetical protein
MREGAKIYFIQKFYQIQILELNFLSPHCNIKLNCVSEPKLTHFLTNFNSIVNSNILLNKIFLEVSIPKIFIDNGLSLITNTKKETDLILCKNESKFESQNLQNSMKDDYSKLGVESNNYLDGKTESSSKINTPNLSTNNFNRKQTINTTGTNLNLKIEKKYSDPQRHFSSKPSSPSNGLNNIFGYPCPGLKSPEIRKNINFNCFNFQPIDLGSYMANRIQGVNNYVKPTTQNFPVENFSKNENPKNVDQKGINFRRFSENTSDKFISNRLSNIMNNNLRSPQMPLKVNSDIFIPLLNPINMMNINSSKGMKSYQEKMQELNNSNSNYFNLVYNYDFLHSSHNSFLKNGFVSPRGVTSQFLFPERKKEIHNKNNRNQNFNMLEYKNNSELSNFFSKKYDGLCNLMVFVKNCTISFVKNSNLDNKVVYFFNFRVKLI